MNFKIEVNFLAQKKYGISQVFTQYSTENAEEAKLLRSKIAHVEKARQKKSEYIPI